jgi:polysaccharide biosynthesis transport protein
MWALAYWILNTYLLSTAYIDCGTKSKKARTDSSIDFIQSQLPQSRKRLEESSQSVE